MLYYIVYMLGLWLFVLNKDDLSIFKKEMYYVSLHKVLLYFWWRMFIFGTMDAYGVYM